MRSAKITLIIYAMIIVLTVIIFGGCSSTKYYPEFGQTMTKKEARERYKAFNERQKEDENEEEREVRRMNEIRIQRDSLMATRSGFEITSSNIETTDWENVTFENGTYYTMEGELFNGKLLSLYPSGSPELQATVMDGKLNGEAKEYYPNGSTKIIKNYYQGFLVDEIVEYFPNGDKKLEATIVNQSTRGGDEVRDVFVGFYENDEYKFKTFNKGRIQLINEGQRTGRTNLTMPLEDQRGYMLFERGAFGEKAYTTDSRRKTAPTSATSLNYNNSIVKGKILSSSAMQEDVLLLKKVLQDVHPGLYRYNTEEEFEAHFQNFYNKLDRDMTEAEFMKHLAQFTEKIKCGHTYVNPWNMRKEIRDRLFGGNIYFPFGFQIQDGSMYVTKNASNNLDIQIGAEIISINGFSASTILDSLYTVAKIDGNNVQAKNSVLDLDSFGIRDHNFFDFYFPLFFPMETEVFTVVVKNYESEDVITHTQPALSREKRLDIITERYGEQPVGKDTWSLEIEDNIATLTLGTFATWNFQNFSSQAFFDSTFALINNSGVKNLAIDIRGNGGGLAEPRNELLSYISQKEIPCTDNNKQLIVSTKADSSYREYVETWEEIIFMGIPEDYYTSYNDRYKELLVSSCQAIQPNPDAFEGNVYIYGNQTNVSSTFILLNTIQREKLGTYVGQPSGGNTQGINGSNYFFLYLPNSQFEVDIPLQFTSYGEETEDGALQPDELVIITQQDIALNNDVYFQRVSELSKQ